MSREEAEAALLADGGAACAGQEFFRSEPFYAAEGVTHTLAIEAEGCRLAAPLIVRAVEGSERSDAVSPYGYPGLEVRGDATGLPLDTASIDFAPTGLISAFLRHRLGAPPPLAGATHRNTVLLADPASPRKSRPSDRQQIRRNLRQGLRVEVVEGPQSDPGARAGFLEAYEQTMRRAGAADRYFFGAAYFDRILSSPRSRLALALGPGGEVAAGSVCVRSDSMLHYYLSGTVDSHLRGSPMKNIVEALVDLAWETGLPLNLGGGLRPGDRLEEFKRGFANREEAWHTSELVCDRAEYERLSAGSDADDFFPAYRA
ncbi:MAG: GNAT family N-acetyltransferase [Solirubrobacterales bacterium]